MRKLCLIGVSLLALSCARTATAADLAVAAPIPVPVWSWTGLYVGSHIGEGWAFKNWESADGFFGPAGPFGAAFIPFSARGTSSGVFGGMQAGFNLQNGPLVWGIELEGATADLDGNARCALAFYVCNSRIDYMGTLTGRVGFAFDHVLLYARGGGAYAHDDYQMTANVITNAFTGSDNRFGWTLGGGVEYAFSPAWSAKLEYDYLDLGSEGTSFTDQFGNQSTISIEQQIHRVKAGVNYRFDWGAPLVARY
jgi:opacity protein-like surface antigen